MPLFTGELFIRQLTSAKGVLSLMFWWVQVLNFRYADFKYIKFYLNESEGNYLVSSDSAWSGTCETRALVHALPLLSESVWLWVPLTLELSLILGGGRWGSSFSFWQSGAVSRAKGSRCSLQPRGFT